MNVGTRTCMRLTAVWSSVTMDRSNDLTFRLRVGSQARLTRRVIVLGRAEIAGTSLGTDNLCRFRA
jgi:hypothetical protein